MRGRAYTLRIAQWYVTQSEVDLRGPLVVPEHRVAQDQDAGENFDVSIIFGSGSKMPKKNVSLFHLVSVFFFVE